MFLDNSFLYSFFIHFQIAYYLLILKIIKINSDSNFSNFSEIRVEPNNPNFHLTPCNLIVSKSSKEKESYDVLVHSFHNIFDITIPNDIEIIGPYAFYLCKQLKTINFYKYSKLRIIGKNAFSYTRIRSLKIPKSLVELKNGWNNQSKICKLEIDQDNQNFTLYDDNLVLSKSSKDKEKFDVLELSNDKEITKATIPNFIEIIKSNAFLKCRKLKNIDFQENSNLQIINKHAFELTSIESLTIPSHIKIIKPYTVSKCRYLQKVDFLPDCELQIIDSFSFGFSHIRKISFPAHVKIIKENAFHECNFLFIIEFPSNSEIQKIDKNAFGTNSISEFTIPPSLHYFDYDWFEWRCYDRLCDQYIVKKLNVLPNNPCIKVIDNTFVVCRESEENENFNTLIFVSDNFERIKDHR